MSAFQLFCDITVMSATLFVVCECVCAWGYLENHERIGWVCLAFFIVGCAVTLALYVNGVLE